MLFSCGILSVGHLHLPQVSVSGLFCSPVINSYNAPGQILPATGYGCYPAVIITPWRFSAWLKHGFLRLLGHAGTVGSGPEQSRNLSLGANPDNDERSFLAGIRIFCTSERDPDKPDDTGTGVSWTGRAGSGTCTVVPDTWCRNKKTLQKQSLV